MEEKRVVKRTPPNIDAYFLSLAKTFEDGCEQANLQAHCLFTIRRFGHQQDAIVVTTFGDWWMCRVSSRLEWKEVFDHERYNALMSHFAEQEEEYDDDDDVEQILEPSQGIESTVITGGQDQRLQDLKADQKDQERTERLAERIRVKEALDLGDAANALDLLKLATKNVHSSTYTDDQIDQYWKIQRILRTRSESLHLHLRIPPLGTYSLEIPPTWSGIMRVGSPMSDHFMSLMKSRLTALAVAERERRNK